MTIIFSSLRNHSWAPLLFIKRQVFCHNWPTCIVNHFLSFLCSLLLHPSSPGVYHKKQEAELWRYPNLSFTGVFQLRLLQAPAAQGPYWTCSCSNSDLTLTPVTSDGENVQWEGSRWMNPCAYHIWFCPFMNQSCHRITAILVWMLQLILAFL